MKKLPRIITCYLLIPFLASLISLFVIIFSNMEWLSLVTVPGFTVLLYLLFRKKVDLRLASRVNAFAFVFSLLVFTLVMVIASGNIMGSMVSMLVWPLLPFYPVALVLFLMGGQDVFFLLVFLTFGTAAIVCSLLAKERINRRKWILASVLVIVCGAVNLYVYANRPEVKYGGHGFLYMNGYSSTDFTDYMVYSDPSKLVELDHEANLRIENEDEMPIMDGAEACYPLYAALAKAVYADIDKIESDWVDKDELRLNGKIVTFTNSLHGFERLICSDRDIIKYRGKTDLFFGAKPSMDQLDEAASERTEVEVTPIGREGFVFFVEDDNPVENLTSEQVKAIYHGDIKNWSEVGGKDEKIIAFQRPRNSGSQTIMEYFMGDVSLQEPMKYEYVDSMAGVISHVAQYNNEAGAIGYTFRYFLEGLQQEKGVKLLAIDGVQPTLENIENGTYPLTTDLCLITRKDDPNPNVKKMIDFILSEDGQDIVRRTGYAAVAGDEMR